MKELIGTALMILGLYAGTQSLKTIHTVIQRAALERVARGMPPLPRLGPDKLR